MNEGLNKYDDTDHLVEVDVVVQGKNLRESKTCKSCDWFSQDKYQDQNWIEEEGFTTGSRCEVEEIWDVAIEHRETREIVDSLTHDDGIDQEYEHNP